MLGEFEQPAGTGCSVPFYNLSLAASFVNQCVNNHTTKKNFIITWDFEREGLIDLAFFKLLVSI